MRIAYFLRSIDFLFLDEKENDLFPILPRNSEEERLATEELSLKNFISIEFREKKKNFSELSDEDIIRCSNLTQKLKDLKIDCLFIRNSTKYLRAWSFKNKITLLTIPYQLREKFENKIYFQKFLEEMKLPRVKSKIINSRRVSIPFQKTVVQIPNLSGGEGNFLVTSKNSFREIIKKLKLPLLATEYEEGLALGASIFISKRKIYFSAINRQCFIQPKEKNRLGFFIGVQWLPYNFFAPEIYEKIEEALRKAGEKMRKKGLTGLVNLDFILNNDSEIFFLESNPRITAATTQIITIKELNGGTNLLHLLLNHYCNKTYSIGGQNPNHLPKSLFSGAEMTTIFPLSTKFPKKIKKIIKGGFFVLKKRKIKRVKLKDRFNFLKLRRGLFYYSEINEGEIYKKGVDTGTVLSNFPLYDFKTGNLNKEGKIVYDYFIRRNS